MGVEYKIRFPVKDRKNLEFFLTRLSKLYKEEVVVALENDGFYFCDNLGDRTIAANIFYRLIQEASNSCSQIIIDEL
ncbi:MAG: hypothetical protein K1X72_21270 [Pyrinomonadaceae bacterium]|nr:hypothetical protein [Pyrinomonadaceae bacterium]